MGRRQGGNGAGSQWQKNRQGEGKRRVFGRGSGRIKQPFHHSWEEKKDKEQEQGVREYRDQLLNIACGPAGHLQGQPPGITRLTLLSLERHHHLKAWCAKAIFLSEDTSWLLIAKLWLKIGLKTKLCFFCAFPL